MKYEKKKKKKKTVAGPMGPSWSLWQNMKKQTNKTLLSDVDLVFAFYYNNLHSSNQQSASDNCKDGLPAEARENFNIES